MPYLTLPKFIKTFLEHFNEWNNQERVFTSYLIRVGSDGILVLLVRFVLAWSFILALLIIVIFLILILYNTSDHTLDNNTLSYNNKQYITPTFGLP